MESKIYGVYSKEHDLTFVMEEKFTDSGEPYTLEVKGFYYGAPDDDSTKIFYGDLVARFAPRPQTTTREYLVHMTIEVDDNRALDENDVQSLCTPRGGITMKKHYRKPRKIVRVLKRLRAWIVFIFTGRGPILKESVDEGLVDRSGQGRDKYGK